MKKVLSVIILLAFFGSMIIMTGCFGGSDGIGAVLGAAFVIAIVASSGGSAATAAFAANTRTSLRPAIASTSTDVTMRVLALDDKGQSIATYTIENSQITWNDEKNGIDTISSKISIPDSYNQYRIQVLKGTAVILEGMDFFKTSEKTGEKNLAVTASSTAKVMIYDKWNTSGTERNFDAFSAVVSPTDVDNLANNITTSLANDDYDHSDLAVPAAPDPTLLNFDVKGYVTAGDGTSGSTGTHILASDANDTQRLNAISFGYSENGNYTLRLPNGSYVLVPSKPDHTFNPTERTITVKNDDLANLNFQAAPAQSFTASGR
jgi:hypothetical protein